MDETNRENQPLLSDRERFQSETSESARGPLHARMDLNPTVYTSALYSPSIARIVTGHEMNKATQLAIGLIVLNMVLQMGLLRVLDIYGHRDSLMTVAGLIEPDIDDTAGQFSKKTYEAFLTPVEKEVVAEADHVQPLCKTDANGTYSCMAPSIYFTKRWRELDLDGDGVWTMSEAVAREKELKTNRSHHHGASVRASWIAWRPTLVFSNIVNGLKHRASYLEEEFNRTLYLSSDLKSRRAISKAYFLYWTGDAMMCTKFGKFSCESVVASGLFDAALAKGRMAAASKGISDYDSAAKYCQSMLSEGGGCEQSLPASFKENTLARTDMCGAVALRGGKAVANPKDSSDVIAVMEPSYKEIDLQKQAYHSVFLFFKMLVMFIFYSSVVEEIGDLIKSGEFLIVFPGVKSASDPGGILLDEEDRTEEEKKYRITGVSRKHRAAMVVLYLFRVAILTILCKFGSWFLLAESRYIELVMNALALGFITGIDEMVYTTFMVPVMENEDEDGFETVEQIEYISVIPEPSTMIGYFFSKECWALILIPCLSVFVVLYNASTVRGPLIEALTCTCLQQGPNCAESMVHQEAWWNHYWTRVLPNAMHQIEALRIQGA